MKKVLTLLLLAVSITVFAQAPQGLNYQAVAYNASGTAVANQAVRVRLSILDGAATGSLLYQEVQNPTTDNTGLFSIVIGNGAIVSGTFADINWGSGSKWLKTEIDITGGANYLVMGTSQFMSVPYALYAEKAGNTGVSLEFPDGLDNIEPVILDTLNWFVVPNGKNLYTNGLIIKIDSTEYIAGVATNTYGKSPTNFIGASSGTNVKGDFTGFLVDKKVSWISTNLACNPLTIPSGKNFILRSVSFNLYPPNVNWPGNVSPHILINGHAVEPTNSFLIVKDGDILTSNMPCNYGFHFINGYFINKYL